jgi:hypothetical protein
MYYPAVAEEYIDFRRFFLYKIIFLGTKRFVIICVIC